MQSHFPALRGPSALTLVLMWFGAGGLALLTRAEPILLRPAESLYASGALLQPGIQSIPCVTDWNGDGQKDLLVGYRSNDKVALYLNSGTDAQPVFTTCVNLQAGGIDIQHPSSNCGAPAPWGVDYDGDGKRDLLVGTGDEGFVYFYRNTNTDASPILAPGQRLTVNASTLAVPARATPYVYDWDGDGLNDLICGAGDGYVYFFRNIGSATAPAYAPSTRIQAGGDYLNAGARSAVRMVDWDGDGLEDLICSGSYNASWCRNIGSNGSPRLAAQTSLLAPGPGSALVPINTSYRMRLEVVDWNNDGVSDLLIGDSSGTLFYYEGYHFVFRTIIARSPDGLAIEWDSAPGLKYNLLGGQSPEDLKSVIATNLTSGGKTTSWTNRVPSASIFYRLQVAE